MPDFSPSPPGQPVRILWYYGEIDRILRTPGGPVGRHLQKIAMATAAAARTLAAAKLKQRTGRYAAGFRVEVYPAPYPAGFKYIVVNRTTGQSPKRAYSYASTIEFGSKQHVIRARNPERKKLTFYWPAQGRWVTTVEVTHPGTKAYSILNIALRTGMSTVSASPSGYYGTVRS